MTSVTDQNHQTFRARMTLGFIDSFDRFMGFSIRDNTIASVCWQNSNSTILDNTNQIFVYIYVHNLSKHYSKTFLDINTSGLLQLTSMPVEEEIVFDASDVSRALNHVYRTWDDLTMHQTTDEGTLIGMPHPYIVPSKMQSNGFSFKELYYWDSFFTAKGLRIQGKQELDEGMLDNLVFLANKFGIIPNGSRFYLSSRSQPPILTSYIFEIFDYYKKDGQWLADRISVAEAEYYNVWTSEQHPNNRNIYNGLSRYYDINMLDDLAECESGWDMNPRFEGKCLSFIPIDLNCLLHHYEVDFAKAYEILGDHAKAETWKRKADLREKAVNGACWNEELGFYFDYNFVDNFHSEVFSLASYYPMSCGLASTEQAEKLVKNLYRFNFVGGLAATSSPDSNDPRLFNKQWAYPNGWAPLHWRVIDGLEKYGYQTEARNIARKWLKTNLDWFVKHGVFREAYNVVAPDERPQKGVYPCQIGFGWTNGIFVDLAHKYFTDEEMSQVPR